MVALAAGEAAAAEPGSPEPLQAVTGVQEAELPAIARVLVDVVVAAVVQGVAVVVSKDGDREDNGAASRAREQAAARPQLTLRRGQRDGVKDEGASGSPAQPQLTLRRGLLIR